MRSLLILFCTVISAFSQSAWSLRTTPSSFELYRPAGKKGVYLVPTYETNANNRRYLRSTDGVNWVGTYLPDIQIALACENGRFVGIQDSPAQIWFSDNGSTSTGVTSVTGGNLSDFYPISIAYGNGTWIITGDDGTVLRSANNAVSWRLYPTPAASLGEVVFGNGKFLIKTSNPASITSSDGITWTIGPRVPGYDTFCFADGLFITDTHTSADGITWDEIGPEKQNPNPSTSLVAGSNGTALSWSRDSQPLFSVYESGAWHGPYPSGILSYIRAASLCGDMWVAITENSKVLTSSLPTLPPPVAPLLSITPALRLSWPSVTGRSYLIQRSTNQTTWTDYTGTMLGTGATMEWLAPASASKEFFRVQVR